MAVITNKIIVSRLNLQAMRAVSLFGIIGVIFFFMHILFGRIFYEGYNPFAQAISDLTAANSPSKNIASVFSFLYGIFSVMFSVGFFVYFKGKINKIITVASCLFCAMTLISFFGYAFFPLSQTEVTEGKFQDIMHLAVTILVVLLTIISIILFGIGFLKTKDCKILGIISLFTFLLLLTGATLVNILPKEYLGVAQRINVYSMMIYTAILSLWMYLAVRAAGE